MIIIKIIIQYFIQIRHTDDFPSTGIPASSNKQSRIGDSFWVFFAYKTILGQTETRTRDRMCFHSIRPV